MRSFKSKAFDIDPFDSWGFVCSHGTIRALYAGFAAAIYIIFHAVCGMQPASAQDSPETPPPDPAFMPVEEIPSVKLPAQSGSPIESGLGAPTSGGAGKAAQREQRKRKNRQACEDRENVIHLIVSDVRSDRGTITADLHGDRPEEFLKKGAKILRVREPAEAGQVALCLPAPGSGTYAIGLYHDENGNRRLDKNFLGIPVEPLGVSNNSAFFFGPPSHADSAFLVGPEGTTLEIVLKY